MAQQPALPPPRKPGRCTSHRAPLLRILRTTRSGSTRAVLETNDTRLPADRYEIGYLLRSTRTTH
ncbi:MAG TPA: hypothetical protein VFX70_20245 [Mycobacteriales bacterium]|nr:hypothetical protein [Mycobacteriales bacterium]